MKMTENLIELFGILIYYFSFFMCSAEFMRMAFLKILEFQPHLIKAIMHYVMTFSDHLHNHGD